jgi:hypothetical protein
MDLESDIILYETKTLVTYVSIANEIPACYEIP